MTEVDKLKLENILLKSRQFDTNYNTTLVHLREQGLKLANEREELVEQIRKRNKIHKSYTFDWNLLEFVNPKHANNTNSKKHSN